MVNIALAGVVLHAAAASADGTDASRAAPPVTHAERVCIHLVSRFPNVLRTAAGHASQDLGSGSGRDCFALAKLVGESGRVVGVDMTDEQLAVARANISAFCGSLGYAKENCTFVKGYIEDLTACGLENESFDLIVSNCVVNLSPDKESVLREAYRVLKDGGEFHFSDVYCDRRLPEAVTKDETLWGECLAGAMYEQDLIRLCRSIGFTDPRILHRSAELVRNEELETKLGEAKFFSITYRLFKMPAGALETLCEDYGQVAVYKGTIPGSESAYQLDDHHRLVTGKPMLVCGNTAAMLGEGGVSWLSPHFQVTGDRSKHYGLFPCGPTDTAGTSPTDPVACGPSGGCC